MNERVDVLAYDEPVGGDTRDWATSGAVVVGALAVTYGVMQGALLLGLVAVGLALAVRAVALHVLERQVKTRYRAIEAGRGGEVVRAHEDEVRRRDTLRAAVVAVVALATLGYALVQGSLLLGAIVAGLVGGVGVVQGRLSNPRVPRLVEENVDRERADELYELAEDRAEERTTEPR